MRKARFAIIMIRVWKNPQIESAQIATRKYRQAILPLPFELNYSVLISAGKGFIWPPKR